MGKIFFALAIAGLCFGQGIRMPFGNKSNHSIITQKLMLEVINPYIDLGLDFGKEYHYSFYSVSDGMLKLSYNGLSADLGVQINPGKYPATFRLGVLSFKVMDTATEYELLTPDTKIYWEFGTGFIPYKRRHREVKLEGSFLRNFGDLLHSSFILSLNSGCRWRIFNLSSSIGGCWETEKTMIGQIQEHPFFMSMGIALSGWHFTLPYIVCGIIFRCFESGTIRDYHPMHKRLMPYYQIGIRVEPHSSIFTLPSIIKIAIPKGRKTRVIE